MTFQMVLDITYKALTTAALAAAPMLITAVVVGVAINIVQSVTQIRDMSLSFVPKLIVAGIVTALSLPWSLQLLVEYTVDVYRLMAQMGHL